MILFYKLSTSHPVFVCAAVPLYILLKEGGDEGTDV